MAEIKDLIKKLSKNNEEIYSLVCTVVEVDENKRVIKVRPNNGDAEVFDVRLQSNVSGSLGFVCYPKIDSEVVISFLSKETAYVALYSEIEKIQLTIGAFSLLLDAENLNINSEQITINDGANGGVTIVGSVVDKLNAIEDEINDLKSKFNAWTPVPNDGGAALKSNLISWNPLQLTKTTINDLENEKLKH